MAARIPEAKMGIFIAFIRRGEVMMIFKPVCYISQIIRAMSIERIYNKRARRNGGSNTVVIHCDLLKLRMLAEVS